MVCPVLPRGESLVKSFLRCYLEALLQKGRRHDGALLREMLEALGAVPLYPWE